MEVKGGSKWRTVVNGTDGVVASIEGTEAVADDALEGDVNVDGGFVICGEEKGRNAEDVVTAVEAGEEEGVGEEGEGELELELELEEEEDNGGEQHPKLSEGFYEIEAVWRKRMRKGEVQYLIKWRGWPETANTWEPQENLSDFVDVVEAFEERGIGPEFVRKSMKKVEEYHRLYKIVCWMAICIVVLGALTMVKAADSGLVLSPASAPQPAWTIPTSSDRIRWSEKFYGRHPFSRLQILAVSLIGGLAILVIALAATCIYKRVAPPSRPLSTGLPPLAPVIGVPVPYYFAPFGMPSAVADAELQEQPGVEMEMQPRESVYA